VEFKLGGKNETEKQSEKQNKNEIKITVKEGC